MCGLAAHDKLRVKGLSQGFQDNLTGLNNARDIKFRKTRKGFLESGITTNNFTIRVPQLSLSHESEMSE